MTKAAHHKTTEDCKTSIEQDVIDILRSLSGNSLSAYRIGLRLGKTAKQISPVLNGMVQKGYIEACVPNRAREYLIRMAAVTSMFAQAYRPDFKPLIGYDIGVQQRMSEGARNPLTGVV